MGRLISLFVVVFGILLSASNAFASNDIEDVNLIFKQVTAHAIEEGIQIQWVIDYEAYQELKDLDYQIVIQYNTKIGAQRFEAGYSGSDWVSVPTMGIEKTFYEIGNLK